MPRTYAAVLKGEKADEPAETKIDLIPDTGAKEFDLMRLDYKSRLNLLDFLTESIKKPLFLKGRDGQKPTGIPLPPIARTGNTRLRLECLVLIIEKMSIIIHSGPANAEIQKWLVGIDFKKLGNDTSYLTGFDAVRELDFPFFSRFPHYQLGPEAPNNDVELMTKCKNLQSVILTFYDGELMEVSYVAFDYVPKSVEQLRREYRLGGILGLTQLKSLHTKVHRSRCSDESYAPHVALIALEQWFKVEFEKRGVNLSISYIG